MAKHFTEYRAEGLPALASCSKPVTHTQAFPRGKRQQLEASSRGEPCPLPVLPLSSPKALAPVRTCYVPRELGQCLSGLLNAERVLVKHVDGRDKQAGPADVIGIVVAVGDGREQVVVLPGDGVADRDTRVIHILLQRVDIHLDFVLGVEATAVDIETRVHPAAEITALGEGATGRQPDHGHVADTALLHVPVTGGLDGMGPELKHAGGNEAQQNDGEEGDVVDAVLGLHSWDEGRTPDIVLDRRTHNDTDSLFLPLLVPGETHKKNEAVRGASDP